ncbi:EAL domain-containing protein [Butyrivibrio sp. MC2021]|uniref:EAL domain-containing protein n=1 Tax=Butyrivibrio sp. MC2021 TaxID=1408306 RepID=UPI0006869F69|nr:EAL domain-containing protein [Butyrivibrio sp. MC2021]
MQKKAGFYLILRAFEAVVLVLVLVLIPLFGMLGRASGEELIIGVPTDRCPVFYIDEDTEEIIGIGVDLMAEAAQNAGYTAAFVPLKESNLKDALDNPEYDLIMPFGSAVESSAGHYSIVTANLTQTPFVLVTKNNHVLPPMNSLHIGMIKSLGGAAETIETLYPGMDIYMFDTMDDCVEALRAGEVDALLHNSYVWSYVLQKPSYSDLSIEAAAMFSMDFRAGTLDSVEARKLVRRLNEGIDSIPETKKQAIVLDYTNRRLYKKTIVDTIYEIGPLLLAIAVFFSLIIVIIVMRLRYVHLENEKKIQKMIDHDPLTGALSHDGFVKEVKKLLMEHPDIPYMISFNNIRDFKFINDTMGRNAADEMLNFWISRSLEILSEEEAIGRLESDHFVVLRKIGGSEKMALDEQHVFEPLRNFFIDRGKDLKVRICSGIYVLMPSDYQQIDVEVMLDKARMAEKKVHDSKKDGYEFYNPVQWEKSKRTAYIISRFPVALRSKELQVWYQPQVDYISGKIIGAEALCRWKDEQLGFISPAEFIPALEEAGLIYDMDCFVWNRVCQDLALWNKMGKKRKISVNLSRVDIQKNRELPVYFSDLISKYDLTADQLCIEITETSYVEDPDLLISTTYKLRSYGFQVEMDDFGSGYSSLNMLKEVPVDRIKLDIRFLANIGNRRMGDIILKHIIMMVRDLGMEIIAEGVEEKEQAEYLKEIGCTEMQGFLFYKALPENEFTALKF